MLVVAVKAKCNRREYASGDELVCGIRVPQILYLYIYEHLSPKNKLLFKKVRTACKAANFKFSWTKVGTIHGVRIMV